MSASSLAVVSCPPDAAFAALATGELCDSERRELVDHSDHCVACALLLAEAMQASRRSAIQTALPTATMFVPRGAFAGRDRYELITPLGRGGMGVVLRAYDKLLHREVALKILYLDDSSQKASLLHEARLMARVNHPNVVPVYDAGEADDVAYVAMELASHGTLRNWLRAREHSPQEIVRRFVRAGRGLCAAHGTGVIHRDFKPDNVLVWDTETKVGDFGLSLRREELDTSSSGTPAYMAPEQQVGLGATFASDQFAFSVSLYEALFGTLPFVSYPPDLRMFQIGAGPPVPPSSDRTTRAYFEIIRRGLALRPESRWASMDQMLEALEYPHRNKALRARTRSTILLGLAAALHSGAGALLAFGMLSALRTTGVSTVEPRALETPPVDPIGASASSVDTVWVALFLYAFFCWLPLGGASSIAAFIGMLKGRSWSIRLAQLYWGISLPTPLAPVALVALFILRDVRREDLSPSRQ